MNYKIQFNNIPWDHLAQGFKQKQIQRGETIFRLIRLDDFEEMEWCAKGHIGYILAGTMKISFTGKSENYQEGDAFVIEKGELNKHKVSTRNGFVELILIEKK